MTLPYRISGTFAVLWSVAILLIVMDAGLYFYSIKPKQDQLAALEREYLQKRGEAKSSINETSGGSSADEELRQIYSRMPRWEQFTKIMGDVYVRAEKLNLFVDSVSYKPSEIKGTDMVKVGVSMPVDGSYGDIKKFIYELESSPNLFVIEGITLSKNRGEGDDISLMLNLTAHFKG